MPPRVVPLLLPATLLASCALASSGGDPDGGSSADARTRADASGALPVPDAGTDEGPTDAAPEPDPDARPPAPDAAPQAVSEGLLITEIVDADLVGGLPKYVELTNLGQSTVNLADYSLGIFSNGNFTLANGASTTLSGQLAPNECYVVSFENSDSAGNSSFRTVYGVDPDNMSFSALINGNDVVVLFDGPATGDGSNANIVDIYGVIGTDGVGEPWEYTDGFATRRQASTAPSPTFSVSDWGFSGAGALDGVDAAGIAAATSPGTH